MVLQAELLVPAVLLVGLVVVVLLRLARNTTTGSDSSETPPPSSESEAVTSSTDARRRTSAPPEASPVEPPGRTREGNGGLRRETVFDERLRRLEQDADGQYRTALLEPFATPSKTKEQLLRSHSKYVSLKETAAVAGRQRLASSCTDTLTEIEAHIDALAALVDAAESLPPTADETSPDVSTLERARERYVQALERARGTSFDTTPVEAQLRTVDEALERLDCRTELLATVHTLAGDLGRAPTREEVSNEADFDSRPIAEHFDTWGDALAAADVDLTDAIREDLRTVDSETEGALTRDVYRREGVYDLELVDSALGGWEEATSSTLDDDRTSSTAGTKTSTSDPETEYIEAIRRVAAESENVVKSTDVRDASPYSVNEIVSAFGSWQDALDAAGVDNHARLLRELRRVADELGHRPTTTEMNEHGHVSATLYADYFGTYTNAIKRVFGDDEAQVTTDTTDTTEQGYLEAIRRVAESSERVVKSTDVQSASPYSVHEIVSAFGSWQDALDAAGVDNRTRLLRELERVADIVGHPPSTTEMNEHGYVSATMYTDYFDTYTDAVAEAFETNSSREVFGGSSPSASESTQSSGARKRSDAERDSQSEFPRLEAICEDGRLVEPIAINVLEVSRPSGQSRDATMIIADLSGTRSTLTVWTKHGLGTDWHVGDWYVLVNARGKHWTNEDGESKRQLSSTKDMYVEHVGANPPEDPAEFGLDSTSESVGTRPSETSVGEEQRDSSSSVSEDSGGIFSDVLTEFEELPSADSE
jgi:hypothetical protein